MDNEYDYRMKSWTPPPRPDWVTRINAEGKCLDLSSVVPLDENSLIDTAKRNTALDDFGEDDWYEPFQVFIKALEEEAELTLMGRLMTRSDILMHLEARLRIEDLYKKHPEIDQQTISSPILIVGSGRCGTSAMQNLLALDPANASPKHWEALLPAPPPEAATYRSDPRIKIADQRMTQWNRVTPQIMSMHEFGGEMPTELIQLETLSFQSSGWLTLYGFVPSYSQFMAERSAIPALQYAKRVLKVLQWKNPRQRWLLKSPDALRYLPDVFKVFPDLKLVFMHRDPIKAVSSAVSLVGTLFWIRSDRELDPGTLAQITNPQAMAGMFNQAIDWIEDGSVPRQQIVNVLYQEFVVDPLRTIAGMYQQLGITLQPEAREAISDYLKENPREKRPSHHYDTGKEGLRTQEQQLFQRYQQYFGVATES